MKHAARIPTLLGLVLAAGCRQGGPPSQPQTAAPPPGDAPKAAKLAPSRKGGKPITIAMIPKLKGIDYFNACRKGAEEAAKELGSVTLEYDGPIEARVDKQVEMIDGCIARKVDVIALAANDPIAVAPALKRARDRGIHVVTWDADADAASSGREFFINQATFEAIGNELVDVMAREAGPASEVAIVTSSLTAPNQNEWMKWMKKRMAAKYPGMKLVDTRPSEENQDTALRAAQDIMKAHPGVRGIWGISSTAFPGAAAAVKQAGKGGKVAVVGLSTPKQMRVYVDAGVVKTVVLWNPVDLGYLAVYAARALVDGALEPGATALKAGRLGERAVKGDQVLLGPAMRFTKANIAKYDF